MKEEIVQSGRGTILRRNDQKELRIVVDSNRLDDIFFINGNSFYSQKLKKINLLFFVSLQN